MTPTQSLAFAARRLGWEPRIVGGLVVLRERETEIEVGPMTLERAEDFLDAIENRLRPPSPCRSLPKGTAGAAGTF